MSLSEQQRVKAIINERLTSLFEDYLSENIGEDILSAYYEGFTVAQVAIDLNEAIQNWANNEYKLEALVERVEVYADDYLDDLVD